ncbi:MAG: hypothetical protein AAF291_00305 [Pseudomonadota bacterium]
MTMFRLLLAAMWLVLAIYTAIVIANHGMGLLPIFFGDIVKLGWPGQFNLDFLLFLILSALWTAWRNSFSGTGLGLALLAFFGGAGFLLPYLIFLSFKEGGDFNRVLLGARARRKGASLS